MNITTHDDQSRAAVEDYARRVAGQCPCCAHDSAWLADHPEFDISWDSRGPTVAMARLHGVSSRHRRWMDHCYMERLDDGRQRYIAEPYSLHSDDWADLAHLEATGFRVDVTATNARHFPGHTVAVEITEDGAV